MNVLITGASGFFGSHIAEAFQRAGHHVIGLLRRPVPLPDIETRIAALDQPDQLEEALRGAHVIVHAAAKVDPYGPWHEFHRVTVEGTRNIIDAAKKTGVVRFIHISSRGIYERPAIPGIVYDENLPYGTPYRWSYYARAKIEAEKLVLAAGIPTTIFRPTWVYGPRDVKIFSRVVEALWHRHLRWIGAGDNILNLIYATDAARAVVLAADNPRAPGQIYNLSADELSPTQREFITDVCQSLNLPLPTGTLPVRLAHALGFLGECAAHVTGFRVRPPLTRLSVLLIGRSRHFSNEKLKRELGWQPEVGFREGIQRTVEWLTASHRARTTTPSMDRTG